MTEADEMRFRAFVDGRKWVFAKTYAAFCPHEYTLKRGYLDEEFMWFCQFVWDNGFEAVYGKSMAKYYVDRGTGFYYFVFPEDVGADGIVEKRVDLINRSSLQEFEFVQDGDLLHEFMRVKRKPKDRRGRIENGIVS